MINNQLISGMAISGEWGNPNYLWIPDDILNKGWGEFVKTWMQPLYDMGVRRYLLRCPFGQTTVNGNMIVNFDEYDKTVRMHDRMKVSRMLEFSHIMKGFINQRSGDLCEVIAYIGCPNMSGLDRLERWQYFLRNIKQFTDAGCSIGFDAIVVQSDHGPEFEAILALKALGTKVYVEGAPTKDNPLWANNHVITQEINDLQSVRDGWGVPQNPKFERLIYIDQWPQAGDCTYIQSQIDAGKTVIAGLTTALIQNKCTELKIVNTPNLNIKLV